jgi:hypothetical protein
MKTDAVKMFLKGDEEAAKQPEFALGNGDCGVVIRANGEAQLFNIGFDVENLVRSVDNPTPEQQQLLHNAETLLILGTIIHNQELRAALLGTMLKQGIVTYGAANAE